MTLLPRPPVFIDIVEEHFEELDFLWALRESVVFAPDWTLADLAAHESRAEAHLDGLRAAQGHSVEIARPALTGDDTSAATAAALTLMSLGSPELEAEVVVALAGSSDGAREGIRVGLRHSDISRVAPRLQEVAAQGDFRSRAAALDVLAFHRCPAPRGLPELVLQAGPDVRSLIDGALGRLGGPWSIDEAQKALVGDSEPARRSALETSARLGVPNLAQVCRKAATRPQNPSPAGLAFLGVLGDPQDQQILRSCLGHPALARAALTGLGALGCAVTVPPILDAMSRPGLALAAGEAFRRITGAEGIEAEQPLPPPEGLSEEELEFFEPAVPPDPEKCRAWWEREKPRFDEQGRWQAGLEVSREPLGGTLNRLPLAFRRDVYLAMRARDPVQTPDIDLEKRARLQLAGR